MKAKLVVISLLLSLNSYSFSYFNDGCVWTIYSVYILGTPYAANKYQYSIKGDTIIGGLSYHKLYYRLQYDCLLRQEGQKVYMKTDLQTDDILLYDFSANVGDTIKSNAKEGPISSLPIVTKVDSVLLENGEKRKRIFMNEDIWIEGIGSISDIKSPLYWKTTGAYVENLVCFKKNKETLFTFSDYCFGDCCTFESAISQQAEPSIRIFLKSNMLCINSQELPWEIAIYNSCGRCIREITPTYIQNDTSLSNLPNGVYIVTVKTANKIFNRKIVVNR